MEIIGVDTGGTFTDFIFRDARQWKIKKVPSTPQNPALAVIEGLNQIKWQQGRVVHGSTVGTNALLERKGARTALLTNRGFTDILEIGRQERRLLYALDYQQDPPLIPRQLRFGVGGRLLPDGSEIEALNEEEVQQAAREMKEQGVLSVAVVFLYSYLNPEPEQRAAEILQKEGFAVSASHNILNEFREYERTSTTAVNAYLVPKMRGYLGHLADNLGADNLSIMQSNGGRIRSEIAREEPVRTVLSGPAGGVVGAYELGKIAGYERLMTLDMGGTSTDVALLKGGLPLTTETRLGGQPLQVPIIDIHTVGAGGGSLAHLDEGGALRVGPASAGADPGPICYGKGDIPTVTDANLFLGRLWPEFFLGGDMKIDARGIIPPLEELAGRAGLSPRELAEGICSVAGANMERALRVISVEKGYDPGDFSLFSFGGAGGMHAVFLARSLGIPRVIIPLYPGILSAVGMLLSDIIREASRTVLLAENEVRDQLGELFSSLEEEIMQDMAGEGFSGASVHLEYFLDMRYQGQSFELTVPYGQDYSQEFHRAHQQRYGYHREGRPLEIVNLRVRGRGVPQKPSWPRQEKPCSGLNRAAYYDTRPVIFAGERVNTPLYWRSALQYGNKIQGPALILEYSSTTVLPPQSRLEVDPWGNMIVEVKT